MWDSPRSVPVPIVMFFTLAGFISAYGGSSYSARVKNLAAQNNQIALAAKCNQGCEAIQERHMHVECTMGCEASARREWYRQNVALSAYADRQWWIWSLGFPISMMLAVVVSMGWLPSLDFSRIFAGAMILFGASVVVAIELVLLQYLGLIPAAVTYAFLLSRASAVMTGASAATQRDARRFTFRMLLLCIPAGMILGGLLELVLSDFSWFAGIEITWGFAFGASLWLPMNRTDSQPASLASEAPLTPQA